MAITEDARVLASTWTICPRGALNPEMCALTRYGPGESERSVTRPSESVTPNTRADAGRRDDRTRHRHAGFVLDQALDRPGRQDAATRTPFASRSLRPDRERSTHHPHADRAAINPDACLMFPPAATGRAVIRR